MSAGLRGRRAFMRPKLDAMQSSQDETGKDGVRNSGQNPFSRSGEDGVPALELLSSAQQIPPGVGVSTSASITTGGGGLRQSAVQEAMNQNDALKSYVVSDSGNQLTLGPNLHINKLGVREFGTASTSGGAGGARMSQIRQSVGASSNYKLGIEMLGTHQQQGVGGSSGSGGGVKIKHIDDLDFDNGKQIGRGSSGKVYDVLHSPSGLRVCVKQMEIEESRHREEIKRELQALHKEGSRFIVDFYGAFFHNDLGVILLVLELMEGSMDEVLKRLKVLTEQQVRAFALQMVHGLHVVHQSRHVIHRDIKPANLLFHRSGQVKITDFGVSRAQMSSMDPNTVMTFVGSISYMSPERLNASAHSYDCDIWSLGVLLCEAVTKYHPFQDDFSATPQAPNFWGLLQKVMAMQQESQTCSEEDSWKFKHPLWYLLHRIPAELKTLPGSGQEIKVSSAMDDFVARCLAFNKAERASAEELLKHPWFQGTGKPEDGPVAEPITLEMSEKIVQGIAFEIALMRQAEQEAAIVAAVEGAQQRGGGAHTSASAALDSLCPEDQPLQTTSGTESNVFTLGGGGNAGGNGGGSSSGVPQANPEQQSKALLDELLSL